VVERVKGGQKNRREVEGRVVKECRDLEIPDERSGIRAVFEGKHEVFIRLPHSACVAGDGDGARVDRGTGEFMKDVFTMLRFLEGKQSRSDCRSHLDGSRIAACDGEGSAYMHLGTTSQRYGGSWK